VRWLTAMAVLGVAVLPLDFLPPRFEAHETHRAGLMLVLALLALPSLRLRRLRSPLLTALVLWCLALALATLFSLTPIRSLSGDLIRRMGLLTHLALVAGALLGAHLDLTHAWRWFWLAGVAVAVYVIVQAAGLIPMVNPYPDRPAGPLGAPTFTAGWLALALLWAGLGRGPLPTFRAQPAYFLGLVLMLAALVLTGSRGATLALAAGLLTAALTWAALHRARWLVLGLLAMVALAVLALLLLSRTPWDLTSPLARLPLVARLNPALPDVPRLSRQMVWANALMLARHWPALQPVGGTADRWHPLRPLVGYGLETFEFVHRPLVDAQLRQLESNRPIDRAHNDWLDTLLMLGWLGVGARLALWGGAGYLGLRRLHLPPRWVLGLAGLGAGLGAALAGTSPFLPVAATLGGLVGAWLALAGCAWRRGPTAAFDRRGWLGLAVLSAHLVDLQFSFTTVATGWSAWLGLGLLLAPQEEEPSLPEEPLPTGVWAGLGGAFLVRGLVGVGASWLGAVGVLLGLVGAAWALAPFSRRLWVGIGALWGLGALLGMVGAPEGVALGEVVLVVGGVWLLAGGVGAGGVGARHGWGHLSEARAGGDRGASSGGSAGGGLLAPLG
jgi:O-antigen ligase